RHSDSFGEVAEREPELVHQHGERPRLLDRRQVLAHDVLDEREEERVAVVGIAYHRRQRREAGLTRGSPAALAGDQLPSALRAWAHNDGLDDALRANRV